MDGGEGKGPAGRDVRIIQARFDMVAMASSIQCDVSVLMVQLLSMNIAFLHYIIVLLSHLPSDALLCTLTGLHNLRGKNIYELPHPAIAI